MSIRGEKIRNLLPVLVILLLPVIFFFPLFLTFGVGPREDELMQYIPCMYWLAEHLHSDSIPIWNHLIYGGYSAIADPQSGICYPLNWLAAIIGVNFAYPFLTVAHYWIAGLGMYVLGRRWNAVRIAALSGAIVWMFSGFMLGHRTHYTILSAMSYLPVILWLWDKFINSHSAQYRLFVVIVVIQSLQILAGHIQTAALSAIVVLLYVLILSGNTKKGVKYASVFILSYILVFSLTAYSVLPAIDLFNESTRPVNSYRFFTENSFLPIAWPLIFAPAAMGLRVPNFLYRFEYFGPWHLCELNCFVTLTGLILACFAIKMRKQLTVARQRLILFFAFLSLFAIFMSLGRYNPAYRIFYYIPLWKAFRCPARYLVWLDFSVAAIVVFGIDFIVKANGRKEITNYLRNFAIKFSVIISLCFVMFLIFARYILTHYDFVDTLPASLRTLPNLALAGLSIKNSGIIIPLLFAATIVIVAKKVSDNKLPSALLVLIIAECSLFAPFYDIHFSDIGKIGFRPSVADMLDNISQSKKGFLLPIAYDPYRQPLKELQPFCNLFVDRATITGYGPMLNKYQRRIFSFELWPTTRRWLDIITRPTLLNRYGIKYLIVENRIDRQIQSISSNLFKSGNNGNIYAQNNAKNNSDSCIVSYDMDISLGYHNVLSLDVPEDSGLYEMTFYARRTSSCQMFLTLSLKGVKDLLWNNQSFTLNRWDITNCWRKFLWVFYLPKNIATPKIQLLVRYGSCQIKNIKIAPRKFDLQYLKRYVCPDESVVVYENTSATGNIYFANKIIPVKSREEAANSVLFDENTSGTYVALDNDSGSDKSFKIGHRKFSIKQIISSHRKFASGRIISCRYLANKIIAKVNVPADRALLIIPAGYNRDWRVYIDNRPTTLFCADAISRAVIVPAGTHIIKLQYFPSSLKAGLLLALCAIIILFMLYRLSRLTFYRLSRE